MIVSAILIVSGAVSNPRTRNILSLTVRTFVRKVNSVCFGDIRARQLERSIGGLQSQGYCVNFAEFTLIYVEAVEIFFITADA